MTMKAVRFSRFGGPEVLELVDLPDPGPGEVRIAVRAAGVGQSDWKKRRGYGDGFAGRVRALAPGGVDLALDVAGNGVLPELADLAGGPERVLTVADFAGAQKYGITFSSGDSGRALSALAEVGEVGELIESGRFALPAVRAFPLTEVAAAHRAIEEGTKPGKLVLRMDAA
jgi:NADPH:quinone reductase-like Zn-dependent oxidoreductase